MQQASDSGPFSWPTIVFFAPHSSQLTQRARLVLDAFKQKVVTFKVGAVGLEAHTDGAEHLQVDRDLDRRRAEAVRDYLVSRPLAAGSVFYDLLGDRLPMVPTASGQAEAQNRFVMVRVLGSYVGFDHMSRRMLLCRRWVLDNRMGGRAGAPAETCKQAVDFLVRGDDIGVDLDWRTRFGNE